MEELNSTLKTNILSTLESQCAISEIILKDTLCIPDSSEGYINYKATLLELMHEGKIEIVKDKYDMVSIVRLKNIFH